MRKLKLFSRMVQLFLPHIIAVICITKDNKLYLVIIDKKVVKRQYREVICALELLVDGSPGSINSFGKKSNFVDNRGQRVILTYCRIKDIKEPLPNVPGLLFFSIGTLLDLDLRQVPLGYIRPIESAVDNLRAIPDMQTTAE